MTKKYDIVLKLILYILGLDIHLARINKGDVFNETDIPAQESKAKQKIWFSCPHEDPWRSYDSQAPSSKGTL